MDKIIFIGCGQIAHFHADVLTSLGCKIVGVAAKEDNERLNSFKDKYQVTSAFLSWTEMVENCDFDAIWVVASWPEIDKMILDLIKLGKPIFVEKPVALSPSKIREAIELQNIYGTKVQIGYNRRFYKFVPALRERLVKSKIRSVIVEVPETTKGKDDFLLKNLWLQNSSHVIDLLYHLIGEFEVIHSSVQSKWTHLHDTFNSLFQQSGDDYTFQIHLISVWDSPSNFSIKIFMDHELIELKPLEVLRLYQGFDIRDPTPELPIRQYIPKIVEEQYCGEADDKFKPGFYDQARHFLGKIDSDLYSASTLQDALYVTETIFSFLNFNGKPAVSQLD